MTGEFNFLGMYFPWIMFTSLIALGTTRLISIFLARRGLYRHIWHPPLFNIAIFVIVLGICIVFFEFIRS